MVSRLGSVGGKSRIRPGHLEIEKEIDMASITGTGAFEQAGEYVEETQIPATAREIIAIAAAVDTEFFHNTRINIAVFEAIVKVLYPYA